MDIVSAVPTWALQIAVIGLFLTLIFAVGKFFDYYKGQNKSDWSEIKTISAENTKNIAELVATNKVHEHRISVAEDDIKDLQGDRIVRYKRNGK